MCSPGAVCPKIVDSRVTQPLARSALKISALSSRLNNVKKALQACNIPQRGITHNPLTKMPKDNLEFNKQRKCVIAFKNLILAKFDQVRSN